jgi:putative FmdB family regulatory protein
MPIYEFRCAQCGNIQEILVSSSSAEIEMKCNECQGEVLERVLSRVSYSMGSPSGEQSASPCATTKSCGPGNTCTTLNLPGYTR